MVHHSWRVLSTSYGVPLSRWHSVSSVCGGVPCAPLAEPPDRTVYVEVLFKRTGRYRERLQTHLLKMTTPKSSGAFLDEVAFGHNVVVFCIEPSATANVKQHLLSSNLKVMKHVLTDKSFGT